MIENVGLSPSSIGYSNNVGSVFQQALAQEMAPSQNEVPVARPEPPAHSPINYNINLEQQLQPMIHEVSQIAESSGYVGVTSQDIVRAYQTGQSFLADYKA
jgi:hypothetical protein